MMAQVKPKSAPEWTSLKRHRAATPRLWQHVVTHNYDYNEVMDDLDKEATNGYIMGWVPVKPGSRTSDGKPRTGKLKRYLAAAIPDRNVGHCARVSGNRL